MSNLTEQEKTNVMLTKAKVIEKLDREHGTIPTLGISKVSALVYAEEWEDACIKLMGHDRYMMSRFAKVM